MNDFVLHEHGACTIAKGHAPRVRPDVVNHINNMDYDLCFSLDNADAHIKYQENDRITYYNPLIYANCKAKVNGVIMQSDSPIVLHVTDLTERPVDFLPKKPKGHEKHPNNKYALPPKPRVKPHITEIDYLTHLKSQISHMKCTVDEAIKLVPIIKSLDAHIKELKRGNNK